MSMFKLNISFPGHKISVSEISEIEGTPVWCSTYSVVNIQQSQE